MLAARGVVGRAASAIVWQFRISGLRTTTMHKQSKHTQGTPASTQRRCQASIINDLYQMATVHTCSYACMYVCVRVVARVCVRVEVLFMKSSKLQGEQTLE